MKFKTVFGIMQLIFGGIGAIAAVASAIDSIKNGDKRAAIAGTYAGISLKNEPDKYRKKVFDECVIEETNQK